MGGFGFLRFGFLQKDGEHTSQGLCSWVCNLLLGLSQMVKEPLWSQGVEDSVKSFREDSKA
jgi:hypothetical protein